MHQDALGLTLTTQSAAAARAFDHAVDGYLTYRADASQRLGALLQADPECGLAHVLKGYFAMLAYKQAALPMAQQAAADATRCLTGATPREQAHLAALQAWIGQDAEHAAAIWEHILARPSARHRRVPAGALRQFLAGAAGARCSPRCRAWRRIGARICPATTPFSVACASPTRNAATTPKPRKPGAPRSPASRRPVVRARRGACHGDAGPPRRGPGLAGTARATLGRQ